MRLICLWHSLSIFALLLRFELVVPVVRTCLHHDADWCTLNLTLLWESKRRVVGLNTDIEVFLGLLLDCIGFLNLLQYFVIVQESECATGVVDKQNLLSLSAHHLDKLYLLILLKHILN